ncbi:lysylphosphatidylglycerol synthase domain-containing protein [Kitasatospora sp. NPDC101183]|uniref:lysylphosphatidylglycerol synthase domain-containing protein n=1 Tax=Kitasatospora sp. NPDC101183 TaxID=3364100 RepID=UPI00382BF629
MTIVTGRASGVRGEAGGDGSAGATGAPGADSGRVRQPAALLRLLAGIAVVALTLLFADYARATTGGLASDVAGAAAFVPRPLARLAEGLTTAAVLLVPVGLAARRLLGPDRRRALQQVSDGLLAAVLAYGATLLLDLGCDRLAPDSLLAALTRPLPGDGDGHTAAVYGYLAPVLAFMTASGSRERRAPWAVLALSCLAGLAGRYTTPSALLLGLLAGWTVAHGTLYAVGTPDPRPRPGEVLRALRESGLRPVEARPSGPDRYRVRQAEGLPGLDVQLLDRQAVTAAAVRRAWRRLWLRTAPHPRTLRSPRTGLEHEALVTYAALAAGVRTRCIAATAGIGPDTALIAYEHLAGRTLDRLSDEELTDDLLTDAWRQLALLQRREIAHRALVPSAVVVDGEGAVHLVDFADGDIAAGELVLACDIAQLLALLALRVGAERAARTAVTTLGPEPVLAALPLLQPIALPRPTRQALKRHPAEPGGPLPRARVAGDAAPATGGGDTAEAAAARTAANPGGPLPRARGEAGRDGGAGVGAATGEPVVARAPVSGAEHEGARASRVDERRPGARGEAGREDVAGEAAPVGCERPGGAGLLEEIRAEVLRGRAQGVGRPVRVERLRPRTVVAVVGGVVAGWLLVLQFFDAERNPVAVLGDADPGWLLLALLAAAASHVAAGMGFAGFVPERLDFRNVVLAQVAGSFVKLVSPGGVGGIALNTRLLQKAGIPTAQALSSVGVGNLIGLVLHVLQLGAFVYLLDVLPGSSELDALPAVVGGLAVAAALLAVVSAIPSARRWLTARLRPLTAEVLPRLLDLLRNPGRLAVGVAGQLLVSICLITCLYCCARAIGGVPGFASVAVVLLVGGAAGNLSPTPGGAGPMDLMLVGLLEKTALMEQGGATATVVLFRLLTLLLPVLPGWAAMAWLRRRQAL